MRTVAVANQKGGCGKTTTAVNLAAALAARNRRVLLVDLDAQGHAAFGLGVRPDHLTHCLYDVLSPSAAPSRPLLDILVEVAPNLWLAPSRILIAALEQELAGADGRERRLSDALAPIAGRFDVAVLDCAPGLGVLTFNALHAADDLLIPVDASIYSLHGVGKFMETVLLAERRFGKRFGLHVLPTLFDSRSRLARELLDELRHYFGDLLLPGGIRRNARLGEAAAAGRPIRAFDPHCHGFEDFEWLAEAMAERLERPPARPSWLASPDRWTAPTPPQRRVAAAHRPPAVPMEVPRDADDREPPVIHIAALDAEGAIRAQAPPVPVRLGPRQEGGRTCFALHYPASSRVMIAGDFNNWQPEPLVAGADGVWRTMLTLPPGAYRYKFVVDGEWVNDPGNDRTSPNPYGGADSLIVVS